MKGKTEMRNEKAGLYYANPRIVLCKGKVASCEGEVGIM